MPTLKKTELVLDRKFDPRTCRHALNGDVHVLHCHHYMSLYTQLAQDCGMLDGPKLLAEVAEDTYYPLFRDYFTRNGITSIEDRIAIAEQQYAVAGLGQMKVTCAGDDSGEVQLLHSHVDEGWIKKWGQHNKPINSVTCGYIAALFAAVFDRSPRSYQVSETESIVTGAESSKFVVVAV